MTCDYLGGQFDGRAFTNAFAIGVLTCRPLLFAPVDPRIDVPADAPHVHGLASEPMICLPSTRCDVRALSCGARVIMLSTSASARVADRYEA